MNKYHKIQTVYLRDPDTKFRTLLVGQFAKPSFSLLSNLDWEWTEKIDGTNIRIGFDGERVTYGGRTDNAQIPMFLLSRLQERFEGNTALREIGPCTLYGEGYGAKIQKGGGSYIPDGCDFILFDVFIGMWLERHNVDDIARKLDVPSVPLVGTGPLKHAVEIARDGFQSIVGTQQAEGLVMRPRVELLERNGDRVITKIKCKDFRRKEKR